MGHTKLHVMQFFVLGRGSVWLVLVSMVANAGGSRDISFFFKDFANFVSHKGLGIS